MNSLAQVNRELTFLIIAQDSERTISLCLQSLRGLNAVVVDGGSIDKTAKIASDLGAEVIFNPFRYYAQQCNFGLQQIKTPWVFILDSDEILSPKLFEELIIFDYQQKEIAFKVKRDNYFGDKYIKWGALAPDWNIRLFRVGSGILQDREVHPRVITESKLKNLKQRLIHYSYENVHSYVARLNRYTDFDSKVLKLPSMRDDKNVAELQVRIKRKAIALPYAPIFIFIYYYFIRLGILQGKIGLRLALSASYYRIIVKWKYEEQ